MSATPVAATRRSALSRVLGDPRLRGLSAAYFWFCGAEYGVWVAVLVYAFTRGGTTLAGLIALAQLAPATVAAGAGARLIERIGSDAGLRLGYASQFVTLALTAAAMLAGLPSPVVYVGAVAAATSLTLVRPAYASLLPELVDEPQTLTAANIVNGWMDHSSVLAGPGLTGVLIGLDGPGLAIAWFAGTMAVAWVLAQRVRRDHASTGDDMAAGVAGADAGKQESEEASPGMLAALRADASVTLMLALLGIQYVALGALDVLQVLLAIRVLGLGPSGAGYLEAAYGIGCIAGAATNVLLLDARRLALWVLAGSACAGAALASIGVWPTVILAFLMLGAIGTGHAVADVASRTILHRVVPRRMQVSIFGLQEAITTLGLAIGAVAVPVLTHLTGDTTPLIVVGGILTAGVAAVTPALLRIQHRAPTLEDEFAVLRGSTLLSMLSRPVLEDLARALVPLTLDAGVEVVREGELGDRFYLIAAGELEVTAAGRQIRTMHVGGGFGEIALLRDVPRTATVTTLTAVRLYALERAPFLAALTGSAQARTAVESLAEERLHAG